MPDPFEYLKVDLSIDGTQAFLDLRPPSIAEEDYDFPLDVENLERILRETHLLTSLLPEVVEDVVARAGAGEVIEGVIVADSKQPMVPGTDGHLEWLIEQESAFEEDDRGRVNFYSHSLLKNVIEHQELGRLHPAEKGTDGMSVKGEPVPAPEPKELEVIAGENVAFDASTMVFTATIGGRVEMRGTSMVVSRSYQVDGNVDFNSGNIDFDGFVRVTGNVVDNFKVKASEGVQVDGVVEAAFIEAGGSVAVIGGINMREKGEIVAKDDLTTKFMNNSTVRCGGNLMAEKEILNCKVQAGSLVSPETDIAGGEIICAGNVEIREAGSEMAVRTIIQAGYNHKVVREIKELEEDIADREARDADLTTKLKAAKKIEKKLSAEKRAGLTALFDRSKMMAEETKAMKAKLIELRKKIYNKNAQVIIKKGIHAGVVIKIGKFEKSMGQDFDGFRRFIWNEEKYEVEAVFD